MRASIPDYLLSSIIIVCETLRLDLQPLEGQTLDKIKRIDMFLYEFSSGSGVLPRPQQTFF